MPNKPTTLRECTTIQTIKEAEGRFDDKYGAFELCDVISFGDRERLKSHITQTLLSVFESELEVLGDDIDEWVDFGEIVDPRILATNKERQRIRSHLTEVINYLKQK